jgi:hypothetical protein
VGQRGQHRGHADSAEADDDDGLARFRLPCIDHRAAAGQHRAAE